MTILIIYPVFSQTIDQFPLFIYMASNLTFMLR